MLVLLKTGRPSIAPEKLLRALLLQALYSLRSERLLMKQLDHNLLFRWFVGLAESLKRTDALVRATSNLAIQSKRSADLADAGIQASKDAVRLDQRAWIWAVGAG